MYALLVAALIGCCSFEMAYCKRSKSKKEEQKAPTACPAQEPVLAESSVVQQQSIKPKAAQVPKVAAKQSVVVFPMAREEGKPYLLLSRKNEPNAHALGLPSAAVQKHHDYDPQENYLPSIDEVLFAYSQDMLGLRVSTGGLLVEPQRYAHFVFVTYSSPEALAEATKNARDFIWVPVDDFLEMISGQKKSIKSKDGKRNISILPQPDHEHLGDELQQLVKKPEVIAALLQATKLQ